VKRWHDLDALRAFAMLLGIALHAALSFTPGAWMVTDSLADSDHLFDEFVLAVHGFRMPLFFLLSGFFTAMLWRRRGLGDLLTHRARRVVFPFILAMILIAPTVTWVSDRAVEEPFVESGDIVTLVYLGSEGGVRELIEGGIAPDAIGSDGHTPIYAAAIAGDPAMIELLLELGADPNVPNFDGLPIGAAVYFGHSAAAEALVAAGAADPRPGGGSWEQAPGWAVGDATDFGLADPDAGFQLPPMHHLWFLWFLILFVLLFAPVAWLVERVENRRGPDASPWRWLPWLMWAIVPVVIVPQMLMAGGGVIPAFGPDLSISWIPDPVVFAYYLLFFTFGSLLYGRTDRYGGPRVESIGRRWWLLLPLAAVVFVLALWATITLAGTVDEVPMELIYNPLQVLYAWLMIFGLMGLFRAVLSKEHYWARYLSDSSYWMYLTHLTLVILLQAWVRTWDVDPLLKFVFIVATTCTILLILYQLAVRYTLIGTILNGKRIRPSQHRELAPA
jgi:peptidoglycan/LPS O-acetylase OafA/YrhL